MDGVHDLGGVEGFGPVPVETGDAEFRDAEDWQKRAFALGWSPITPGITIDWFRHGIERMVPADYLTYAYFKKWCTNDLMLMLDNGTITLEDVKRGHVEDPVAPPPAMTVEEAIAGVAASNYSFARETSEPPAFAVGARIQARRQISARHTRLPRYVRGHFGKIVAHHGAHVFPDRNAEGIEVAEHLYTVAFQAVDLWGDDADPRDEVTLDLWESYLVSA